MEIEHSLGADSIDVTLPGAPPLAVAAHNLLVRTQREIEDVFVGLGYEVMEGPEVELDYYNFTALNHPPGHPARMAQDTFYVDPATLRPGLTVDGLPPRARGRRPAHAHLADAGPRHGEPGAADHDRRARALLPLGPLRRHPQPGLSPGRGAGGRRADHARRPQGHARRVRAGDLRSRARDPLSPGLLPLHRAERGSGRVVLSLWRLRSPRRRLARPVVQGSRMDRDPRLGDGRPERVRVRRANGYDPERVQGFAFGMGIERIAMLKHAIPDLRKFFENDVRVLEQFR